MTFGILCLHVDLIQIPLSHCNQIKSARLPTPSEIDKTRTRIMAGDANLVKDKLCWCSQKVEIR